MTNYCVYLHTSPTNKYYVGITKQNPLKRWANGRGYCKNKHFYNAILKYGCDNFKHEIIFSGITKEEAIQSEKQLIKALNSNAKNLQINKIPIIQLDLNNNVICVWESATDAGKALNIDNSGISRVCREGESGKYKGKYKNFKWKYF